MASLSILAKDPTLEAADKAMEDLANAESPRPYLGMSQIGESCSRKAWYRFHFAGREKFDALTLKRFEDGHRTEALIIERLKRVPGVELTDIDPATGRQIGFVDLDGHFRGHADGSIIGVLQAPKAVHIFEAKCCAEKKLTELKKAISDYGEKAALKKWNEVYYGQGMLYCDYFGATRHYMVVATPGGRDWIALRTNADPATAMKLRAKANRVIKSTDPLDRVSQDKSWFECRYCPFSNICHENEMPERSCRLCIHSTPIEGGEWRCERWGKKISTEEQLIGCASHTFYPSLVPGEVVETSKEGILYRMPDGSTWFDGEVK